MARKRRWFGWEGTECGEMGCATACPACVWLYCIQGTTFRAVPVQDLVDYGEGTIVKLPASSLHSIQFRTHEPSRGPSTHASLQSTCESKQCHRVGALHRLRRLRLRVLNGRYPSEFAAHVEAGAGTTIHSPSKQLVRPPNWKVLITDSTKLRF